MKKRTCINSFPRHVEVWSISLITSIVPPVWYLIGCSTFLWTRKFGIKATGGTSVIPATLMLHWNTRQTFHIHIKKLSYFFVILSWGMWHYCSPCLVKLPIHIFVIRYDKVFVHLLNIHITCIMLTSTINFFENKFTNYK